MSAVVPLSLEGWQPRPRSSLTLDFTLLASRFGGEPEDLDEERLQRLVDAARQGDRLAAQQLYRQFVDRVFRTVRPLVQNDAEAEDVTQDAMLAVLTSLATYQRRPGTRFVSWVLTIAAHTARRRFRRQRPETADPFIIEEREGEDPETDEAIDNARRRRALLLALADLPERERRVVSLRYGGELNATEIAAITGLSAANVRKLCERSREKLGRRIEEILAGATP